MPTATPFTALGAGNGFPFCLPKVDVSDYTYCNALTFAQAMKFYWNSYSFTMSAAVNYTGFTQSVSNPTVDNRSYNAIDQNPAGYTVGDREPSKRICSTSTTGKSYLKKEDSNQYDAVGVLFYPTPTIEKLYNGATDNESKFIGYGFNGKVADAYTSRDGPEYMADDARTMLFSYAELSSDPIGWWFGWSIQADPDTVSTVTIDGIPFIKADWSQQYGGQTSITGVNFYTY